MMENKIKSYMSENFNNYKEIKKIGTYENFWDILAITVFDEMQKESFVMQIKELLGEHSKLVGRVYVLADPPNKKIGCGGSTLYVLQSLFEMHGSSLYEKRILVIHSGGYSQRLPSYSIQGKVFAPIPIKELLSESNVCYMIELKFAMYLPFCQYLRPGVFVACGDDIETYYLDSDALKCKSLREADVVALSHPCDLRTATGHGVYVLPSTLSKTDPVVVSDCVEVLQKPSIQLMKEKNAVYKNDESGEEYVYSDSVFWMSAKAYEPLLSWYRKSNLDSELDAYAHILTCFGSNTNLRNVADFNGHKSEIFPLVQDLNFKLIVLNESKFYHLGTMDEYLTNFTACKSFLTELNIENNTSNLLKPVMGEFFRNNKIMVAHSFLNDENSIKKSNKSKILIEWCSIDFPLFANGNLILSNCVLRDCSKVELNCSRITFFDNYFYFTAPIKLKNNSLYVTVVYNISDNLKQEFYDINTMCIASVPLDTIIRECNLGARNVLANGKPYSQWSLRLFEAATTPEESFWRTHNFINSIFHWRDGVPLQIKLAAEEDKKLFSMKDIINAKDLRGLLTDRNNLIKLIHSL